MSGWSHRRRTSFEAAFYEFLNHVFINSKDLGGHTCLGEHIFDAQRRMFTTIFDGLEDDIHDFYFLKSRQLGVSTGSRALSTFWLGMHDGLPGAVVFDTDANKNLARREIETLIFNLPRSLKFPRVKERNRQNIVLENGSSLQFMSAGVKASKSSGTLGRSAGLSFAHCSELCSWDANEGVVAFRQALSEINPNRLYIYESTARGYNLWNDLYEEAKKDENRARCCFLGWWSKPSQRIPIDHPDFQRYGEDPLTDREAEKIKQVKELYNHEITPEQLAWYRRKIDPNRDLTEEESDGDPTTLQEQPMVEDDAWQMPGATFFQPEMLVKQASSHASKKFSAYSYAPGLEFTDLRVYPAHNARSIELKVWEEPVEESVYIVACDPAYGHSERSDRSCIQVLRCYSDGLDQVAEYAWPLIRTDQLAWVIASLEGWYAGDKSDVYRILEINGPGEAVFNELKALRRKIQYGYFGSQLAERGLQNIQRNVRNYLYTRSDSMAAGHALMFKTQVQLKVAILERLRDFTGNGVMRIKSMETLEEMKKIARQGDTIEATGAGKDDRVMALALGVRAWDERVRTQMMRAKRTRASEEARRRMSIQDQISIFNTSQFVGFLSGRSAARQQQMRQAQRRQWRGY